MSKLNTKKKKKGEKVFFFFIVETSIANKISILHAIWHSIWINYQHKEQKIMQSSIKTKNKHSVNCKMPLTQTNLNAVCQKSQSKRKNHVLYVLKTSYMWIHIKLLKCNKSFFVLNSHLKAMHAIFFFSDFHSFVFIYFYFSFN